MRSGATPQFRRPDGQVACGWASLRGKRPMNEDTVYCSFQRHDETGEDVGCFGVFDGCVGGLTC